MAETTGVDGTTRVNLADTYVRKDVSPNNSALSMDDFWKLLAAQLRYQDSSNPMSNSEMMGQLVQMGTMSAMDNMSTTITDAMNSLSQISLSSYATGLLGKEITVADVDKDGKLVGETTGKVEGIALTGTNPYIFVNGKQYSLSHIVSMGTVPKKEEEDGDKDDTATEGTDKEEGSGDNSTEAV